MRRGLIIFTGLLLGLAGVRADPSPDDEFHHATLGWGSHDGVLDVWMWPDTYCWLNGVQKEVGAEDELKLTMKPGDVPATYASTDLLQQAVGFKPATTIEEGLQRFADWYCAYYRWN